MHILITLRCVIIFVRPLLVKVAGSATAYRQLRQLQGFVVQNRQRQRAVPLHDVTSISISFGRGRDADPLAVVDSMLNFSYKLRF